MLAVDRTYLGDCLQLMDSIDDKSIDLILCDLPYGITTCNWDSIIPLGELWAHYNRIIKDNGAIVLTASQPFTSMLVTSNSKMFRYEWIWQKNAASNFGNAKRQPLKNHESILVFYKQQPVYNPQGLVQFDKPVLKVNSKNRKLKHINGVGDSYYQTHTNYPKTVQPFDCERGLHPTQKPVALFEYLIRTYTDEGMLVLDNCAGSGTTGIACKNTNRQYILMEKEEGYYSLIRERLGETDSAVSNAA